LRGTVMEPAAKKTILRIELCHGLSVLGLLLVLAPLNLIEPLPLVIGGMFMAVNFFLLSYGLALVLTPLADKRRIKTGIALLISKLVMFLALLTTLLFQFKLDALSFAIGFSTLLVAILVEAAGARVNRIA
jgi:hypothetical protein